MDSHEHDTYLAKIEELESEFDKMYNKVQDYKEDWILMRNTLMGIKAHEYSAEARMAKKTIDNLNIEVGNVIED